MSDDKLAEVSHIDLTNLFMTMDPKTTQAMVEFFASSMDAFLQFYMEAAGKVSDDVEASVRSRAVAAARVAQMGRYMFEVFSLAAEAISYGNESDTKACDAAVEVVGEMVLRNLRRLTSMADKGLS